MSIAGYFLNYYTINLFLQLSIEESGFLIHLIDI
jgi:hypothetical protein